MSPDHLVQYGQPVLRHHGKPGERHAATGHRRMRSISIEIRDACLGTRTQTPPAAGSVNAEERGYSTERKQLQRAGSIIFGYEDSCCVHDHRMPRTGVVCEGQKCPQRAFGYAYPKQLQICPCELMIRYDMERSEMSTENRGRKCSDVTQGVWLGEESHTPFVLRASTMHSILTSVGMDRM